MSYARAALVVGIVTVIVIVAVMMMRQQAMAPKNPTAANSSTPGVIRYLPLGDSYTIGSSVKESERWPNQLISSLKTEDINVQIIENPAKLGYTSQDLINKELPLVRSLNPDIVSVQIGVNDYVQGVSLSEFTNNLTKILDELQGQIAQPKNIFLVTIPDYAKTPAGAQYGDPIAATAAIKKFNAVIISEAGKRDLAVADIFAISQRVVTEPNLVANDGLHPSGAQYKLWVTDIRAALKQTSLLEGQPVDPVRQ